MNGEAFAHFNFSFFILCPLFPPLFVGGLSPSFFCMHLDCRCVGILCFLLRSEKGVHIVSPLLKSAFLFSLNRKDVGKCNAVFLQKIIKIVFSHPQITQSFLVVPE